MTFLKRILKTKTTGPHQQTVPLFIHGHARPEAFHCIRFRDPLWHIDIYPEFGFYKESLISLTRKGQSGSEGIKEMMDDYRTDPPKTINSSPVEMIKFYFVVKSSLPSRADFEILNERLDQRVKNIIADLNL